MIGLCVDQVDLGQMFERLIMMNCFVFCSCGQFMVEVSGDFVCNLICYCLVCQCCMGGFFVQQVWFYCSDVIVVGIFIVYVWIGDEGFICIFYFCLVCGVMVYYELDIMLDFISILVGVFVDLQFLMFMVFVYELCMYCWVVLLVEVEYFD